MCGPRPDFEYHYAGGDSGRIAKHLAKIAIQCDKRSAFAPAHFKQRLVRSPPQTLTEDCSGVMAGSTDQIGRAPTEIFVEL